MEEQYSKCMSCKIRMCEGTRGGGVFKKEVCILVENTVIGHKNRAC
jgi:hypothetical protein